MPTKALVGVPASSGRFVPSKPTLAPAASVTQFTIQNYNAGLIYTVSATSGTATRNGDTITLSNNTTICTVTASPPKMGSNSAASTFERKPFAYSCRTVSQTCCDTCCIQQCTCGCAAPVNGSCDGVGSPNGQCGCGGATPCMFGCIGCLQYGSCNCRDCSYQVCDVLISETGNGYINRGTEWYKVG